MNYIQTYCCIFYQRALKVCFYIHLLETSFNSSQFIFTVLEKLLQSQLQTFPYVQKVYIVLTLCENAALPPRLHHFYHLGTSRSPILTPEQGQNIKLFPQCLFIYALFLYKITPCLALLSSVLFWDRVHHDLSPPFCIFRALTSVFHPKSEQLLRTWLSMAASVLSGHR